MLTFPPPTVINKLAYIHSYILHRKKASPTEQMILPSKGTDTHRQHISATILNVLYCHSLLSFIASVTV